jgi:hypothetical protein
VGLRDFLGYFLGLHLGAHLGAGGFIGGFVGVQDMFWVFDGGFYCILEGRRLLLFLGVCWGFSVFGFSLGSLLWVLWVSWVVPVYTTCVLRSALRFFLITFLT